uniref:CID domain-containing protein n=1 Tax=Syphacia muris TaxID=451379 RepID=A0A0N5AWT2_9BILA
MSRSSVEAASEYRLALENLKDNNKMQINLMTILADDYNSFSKDIVEVIAQQIKKVPTLQKLPVMYVMDSILKNLTGAGNYKEHIEKSIHGVFVHVFETGDERTRLALHKLRQTWNDYFKASTLYKIDLAVHGIDPAWPIVTPQPHSIASTSTAPQVNSQATSAAVHSRNSKVHVNPHFFQKNSVTNGQQQLPPLLTDKKSADPRLARNATGNRAVCNGKTNQVSGASRSLGESKLVFNLAAVKQEVTDSATDVDERIVPDISDDKSCVKGFQRWNSNVVGSRSPNENGLKRRGTLNEANVDEKRLRNSKSSLAELSEQQPSTSTALPRPTNSLGTHAFVSTVPFRAPYAGPIVPQVMPTVAGVMPVSVPSMLPVVASTSAPFGSPDISNLPMVPMSGLPSIISSQLQMPPIISAGGSLLGPGVPVTAPVVAPVVASSVLSVSSGASSAAPPVISSDTPKLEGIPANNRIFVDGRAYEVFFVDDIPVIERNGLPHRIYFTGAPRNVIIDGTAHLLHFGEEKRIIIDGEEHVLRFGAPSRELYMGNYPFKGAFGGPPIFATINGVRHEIRQDLMIVKKVKFYLISYFRLGGPPPDVKIEPDPCYELLPHMPRKTNKPVNHIFICIIFIVEKKSAVDVKELLANLQKRGILSTFNKATKPSSKKDESRADSPNRSATPPIPSEHRGEVTDRMAKPPSDFKNFSMRALKIRYDSVIEALHKTRQLCPNCGLRFNDLSGTNYQQHLDWHFRENLKSAEKPHCREWYISFERWLEFSEQKQLLQPGSTQPTFNISIEDSAKDANKTIVPCDSVDTKECNVCKEKFEESWDEDEDTWILKDCVLGPNGKACCVLDAASLQRTGSEGVEEDEKCDKSLLFASDAKLKRQLLSAP